VDHLSDDAIPTNSIGLRLISERAALESSARLDRTWVRDVLDETQMDDLTMQALLEVYPVTPESLGAVDAKIATQYKVFPLFVKADVIHVALAEELSAENLERLSHILGKQVVVMVVSDQHVSRLIRLHYEGIEESSPANSSQADLEKPEEAGKRISNINKVWESIEESRVERSLSRQGYSLSIEADQITITATAGAGLFYGMQTLIQLVRQYGHRLPALRIEDKPDFRWRGFMLDVSRGRVPIARHTQVAGSNAFAFQNQYAPALRRAHVSFRIAS
jgi:hypothetical protein